MSRFYFTDWCARRFMGILLLFIVGAVGLCAGQPKNPLPPTRDVIEGQPASAIVIRPLNGGVLYEQWFGGADGSQRWGLWVPNDVSVLRGVFHSMHRASEAERTDLQAWARSEHCAVLGVLARWSGNEHLYPFILSKAASAANRPELRHVPLIHLGFSRNVGASIELAMRMGPERTLCLLWGGGPGGPKGPDLDFLRMVPAIQINGDDDPFVDNQNNLAWQRNVYPRYRNADALLAFSTAIDHATGHNWKRSTALHIPFVQAVMAARWPADADQRHSVVALKPWSGQGWLLDSQQWTGTGELYARPAAQYERDIAQSIWVPDEATARTWRSMVSRDTRIEPLAERLANGRLRLSLSEVVAKPVRWFDRGTDLGESAADGSLLSAELSRGARSIWAVLASGEITRPIAVIDGQYVDQRRGMDVARKADVPFNAVVVSAPTRSVLEALAERADSPLYDTWKPLLQFDFSQPLDNKVWYEYDRHIPDKPEKNTGATIEATAEGVLHVKAPANKQAIAMLRGTFPDRVAVSYRARVDHRKPCDLSVVVAGREGGRFPWNQGAMFQFGARFNASTHWIVQEQPKAATTAALIIPGQWHRIRVERNRDHLQAWVDDVMVSEYTMSEEEVDKIWSNRIGFYTFGAENGSIGEFDDIIISERIASDPSRLPAMPATESIRVAVKELVALLESPWFDQRLSAERLMRNDIANYAPFLRELQNSGALTPKAASRIIVLLEGVR